MTDPISIETEKSAAIVGEHGTLLQENFKSLCASVGGTLAGSGVSSGSLSGVTADGTKETVITLQADLRCIVAPATPQAPNKGR